MTNSKLIEHIIEYYRESQRLTINRENFNIWRGVSHSISSKTEDLFALFVAERLNVENLEFIVDKTMSYKIAGQNSIQFRPDLAIVKNGVITHIFDLKMDMGYKRRYHEMDTFKKERIKFGIFRNNEIEKELYYTLNNIRRYLNISSNIINQIVVISEKNEGRVDNRTSMIESIKVLDWVNIYYLTGVVHPNNYSATTLDDIKINDLEFVRMYDDIKANL